MKRMIRMVALALVTGATVVGCGDDGPVDPGPTAAGFTAEGWAAFEAGDYVLAEARFTEALALDAAYADAHTGRGWVDLREGDSPAAGVHFDIALGHDPEARDAQSGRVLVFDTAGFQLATLELALLLLDAAPGYVFPHDPDYAATDVRWLAARAALGLAAYPTAAAQLEILAPGSNLDPEAADFVEDALALLESLRETV